MTPEEIKSIHIFQVVLISTRVLWRSGLISDYWMAFLMDLSKIQQYESTHSCKL